MKVTLLAAGTLGDVQPYLALAAGLKLAGYDVKLATCVNFESLVTCRGIPFAPLHIDYHQLMQAPEVPAMLRGNPLPFLKSFRKTIIPLMRQLLDDSWEAARESDALIYHPRMLASPHIAEKLSIPAMIAVYLPILCATREFPLLLFPRLAMGGTINRWSYSLMSAASIPLQATMNRWRKQALRLPSRSWFTGLTELRGRPLPILHGYSEHVIPRPADWGVHCRVTGYWFLDRPPGWQPPHDLVEFINAGPRPVYIGFGSMISGDPEKLSKLVISAVRQNQQRAIISRGWGALGSVHTTDSIFAVDSVPHDWLFPRMSAVVHHGGAGTTSAGLRAGIPTIVCPFFGDQPYWGKIVADLGVGPRPIPQRRLTTDKLASALRRATSNRAIRERAARLGEKIRSENGVDRAVEIIGTILQR